VLKRKPYHK